MTPLHQIVPELLGKRPRRGRSPGRGTLPLFPAEEIVRAAWEFLAGGPLARRTRVRRIYQDRLLIDVPSSTWRYHLRRYEAEIAERVNRLLGEPVVKSVEWHVNPELAVVPAAAGPAPARKPPARETDAAVVEAAQKIADPELRELFLKTARYHANH
jgi:hypothetical protein